MKLHQVVIWGAIAISSFWGCSQYFRYMDEREALEIAKENLSRYHIKPDSISCINDSSISLATGITCVFKINSRQFFNSLKTSKTKHVLHMNISAENAAELRAKVFKAEDGISYAYMFGSSWRNKSCEAKLTPTDAAKNDLYVVLNGGDSDIHYITQTETGCLSIIFSFG